MKACIIPFILLQVLAVGFAQNIDRKTIYNCKITFAVSVIDPSKSNFSKYSQISYVKDNKSRTDFIAPGYNKTTIYSNNSDTVVILKQVGQTKYITYLNSKKVNRKNKRYEGAKITTTHTSKKILGYQCKQAKVVFPDGTFYYVYYAPAIVPSNKKFERQFEDVPGFVLEYESFLEDEKTKVKYTAVAIDFSLVPAAKFDWPKKDYRVLQPM